MSQEERDKVRDILKEIQDNAKGYLRAKMQQNRKNPSALRRTRLGYAQNLLDSIEMKLTNMKAVEEKYAEVEKIVAGKEQQLAEWKKNPVLVNPEQLKTKEKEVKAPENVGPSI